MIFQNLILDL